MRENCYYELGENPTFAEVYSRLVHYHNERYDLQTEINIAFDRGFDMTESMRDEAYELDSIVFDLAHKVMNNAMFVLSNGAEREFRYELPKEFRDYHFIGGLSKVKSVIYGGVEGTIDIEFLDGTECSDYDDEYWLYDDMYGLAKYLYEQSLNVA